MQLASGSGVSNARTIAAIINELAVNSGRLLSKETLIESVKVSFLFLSLFLLIYLILCFENINTKKKNKKQEQTCV